MPEKAKILIIGAGQGGLALIEMLYKVKAMDIVGVVDTRSNAPGIEAAKNLGIPVYSGYKGVIDKENIDEIINVTGSKKVQEDLLRTRPKGVEIVGGHSAKLFWELIDERDKSEKAFQEAIQTKLNFISMVSHELRTPLAAIKEGIGVVVDGLTGPVNDEQKEFLNMGKRNVDRLTRLINDVLDYQKLEAGRMKFDIKKQDINQVAQEIAATMSSLAKDKGIDIIVNLDQSLPSVAFDRDKITQVMTNLINNALKFTEKGSITLSTFKSDESVIVSVKDTGPGIKEKELDKLFKSFSQLSTAEGKKHGSTGLGLSISKNIVQAHEGKIWVESEDGKGCDFKFRIPLEFKYKVIIIDDDEEILTVCRKYLERLGYSVYCSKKGLEGIEAIQAQKPNLVILDMKLPDIEGYEVIGRLRTTKETFHIPILAISSYSQELARLKGQEKELFLAWIPKPFKLEDFAAKIEALLKK